MFFRQHRALSQCKRDDHKHMISLTSLLNAICLLNQYGYWLVICYNQILTLTLVFILQTNIKCTINDLSLIFEIPSVLLFIVVLDSFGQASMIQHLTNPSPFPPEPSTVAGLFRGRGPVTTACYIYNTFWLLMSPVSLVLCPVSLYCTFLSFVWWSSCLTEHLWFVQIKMTPSKDF